MFFSEVDNKGICPDSETLVPKLDKDTARKKNRG